MLGAALSESPAGIRSGETGKPTGFLRNQIGFEKTFGFPSEVQTSARTTAPLPTCTVLEPVKVAPADLALRVPVYVGPTATVLHDTHPYSMPPEAIGIAGTLFLHRDHVRIVAGRFEATHPRQTVRGAKSTLPEHRAQLVAAVSGLRAKRYLKREQLLELGPAALEYLTEIVHRRPRAWIAEVGALHTLLQQHGAEILRAAFVRALEHGTYGTEYVTHFLRKANASAQTELPL